MSSSLMLAGGRSSWHAVSSGMRVALPSATARCLSSSSTLSSTATSSASSSSNSPTPSASTSPTPIASTTALPVVKPDLAILARLRRDMGGVSLAKVKEALVHARNDPVLAKRLLGEMLAKDAAKREAKRGESVSGAASAEGVVAVVERPGIGAAMVELSCETDFVARTRVFQSLAAQIAQTALLLQKPAPDMRPRIRHVDVDEVLAMPCVSVAAVGEADAAANDNTVVDDVADEEDTTIATRVKRVSGQLGEILRVRRCAVATGGVVVGGVHGSVAPSTSASAIASSPSNAGADSFRVSVGTMGALAALTTVANASSSSSATSTNSSPSTASSSPTLRHLIAHIIATQPADTATLHATPFLFDAEGRAVDVVLGGQGLGVGAFMRFARGEPGEDHGEDHGKVEEGGVSKQDHSVSKQEQDETPRKAAFGR